MLWYNLYCHIVFHIIHKVIPLYLIDNGITKNYECYTISYHIISYHTIPNLIPFKLSYMV